MVTDEPKTKGQNPMVYAPPAGGTFVKDKATAERMLAGARRRLNSMPKDQAEIRIHGIHLTANQMKGVRRRAIRQAVIDGHKRAAEFNKNHGVVPK